MVSNPDWTEGLLGEDVPSESIDLADDSWAGDLLPKEEPKPVEVPKPKPLTVPRSYPNTPLFQDTLYGQALNKVIRPNQGPEQKLINVEKLKPEIDSVVSGLADFLEDTPTHSRFAALLPAPLRKTARGIGDFFSAIPGFVLGVLAVPDRAKVLLNKKDSSVEDLYNAMEGDIAGINKSVREHVVDQTLGTLVGEATPGSEMIGRAIMVPLEVLTRTANSISEWKRFEDSPNIRGVIKFAGFGAGVLAMGKIYQKGRRSEAINDISDVVAGAKDLETKYKIAEEIPDQAIRAAQEKILDAQKVRLELQAKAMMDKLDYGILIKEDLSNTGGRIKQIKQANKYIADEVINKTFEKLPKGEKIKVQRSSEEAGDMTQYEIIEGPDKGSSVSRGSLKAEPSKYDINEELMQVVKEKGEVDEYDLLLKDIERLKKQPEPDTDLDMEIQEREPFQLDTEHSPFRESAEVTEGRIDLYNRVKWQEDPELATGKMINDVNRWLDTGEGDIKVARDSLSEFAGRAEELRDYFRESSDYPSNFDNWREMVSEAASWARKAKRPSEGTKLYDIGGAVGEGAKEIVRGAKRAREYIIKARGMKSFKPMQAAKMLKEELVRSFVDRSGNIRKKLLDGLGDIGYSIIQKMYLSKGASSRSAAMLKQMQKEVYRGLNKNEKRILDTLIFHNRMADIGKYKTPKQFKYFKDHPLEDSIAYIELLGDLEKLSPEQVADMHNRAAAYFEWMKKPLKDMLDSGIISEQEFADLSSHNYRKLKLVDIFDKRYEGKLGKKRLTVYDSGIQALARGKATDVFEPSSEVMALEVFNRSYGRIFKNEANKNLLNLARRDKENPFVRVKRTEESKEGYYKVRYKDKSGKSREIFIDNKIEEFKEFENSNMNSAQSERLNDFISKDTSHKYTKLPRSENDIPSGWDRIFVYDKGERKAIYLSPELSKEWIINNPEMSYKMSQLIRYAFGSQVLRTFATGINWGFAVANLPRDVMHTWFTARSWENGQWKPVYSPHAPVFPLQITRDLGSVFTDALLRKGRYEDYINQGGGMEFMVHQGRILQRGRHLEGPLDRVENFLGYFGETSEILTRLAIRERALRQGKSAEEATFIARDYMDFGQGGSIAKALDNAMPYLNASIQGTRGLLRSFRDNPVESSYKLSQFAALVTGIYLAMDSRAPETKKNLQGSIDMTNNIVIPLGDEFGFVDSEGQQRYPYIKIPLDPSQRFFKKFFEASTDKWLGNEVDIENTVKALGELSPANVGSLPPTLSGALGYMTNRDFWRNEDIWRGSDPFSYPYSREEYTRKTPQAFVDVGQVTGLSPERLRYAVGELVTQGTVWSYLLGAGYDELLGDMPKRNKEEHLAMVLSQTPVFKRFIGVTNPYSKYGEKIDKAQEEKVLEEFVQNRNFDIKVDAFLYGEGIERGDLDKEARSYKDKDTYDRLIDRLRFEEAIKTLPEKSFWRRMKGLRLEAKAKVFADRLRSADEKERSQLWREYGIVAKAKGVISPEFRAEVRKQLEKE